jgi:pyocin large subunit-like protein
MDDNVLENIAPPDAIMPQRSKTRPKNLRQNKHLARNSLLFNSTTISSNLELCR